MRKKNYNKINCVLIMIIITCVILIVDLIAKHYTTGIDQQAIPGFFSFYYTQNTGAAWSAFAGSGVALIVVSCIAIALLVLYVVFVKTNNKLFYISIAMIIGGALGNLFDRLAFGYVRDFIKLDFINFPIFNIADIFLTVGVIVLCVYYLIVVIQEIKHDKKKAK